MAAGALPGRPPRPFVQALVHRLASLAGRLFEQLKDRSWPPGRCLPALEPGSYALSEMSSAISALKLLRRQPLRLLRVGAGASVLAVLIGWGLPAMLYRSGRLLADAGRWAALDLQDARRRTFGKAYVDGIDSIRRELPPDTTYLLVPERMPAESGWELWVRYDLAPRRPILIQSRAGRRLRGPGGTALPKWVDWAVIPDHQGAPVLLTRDQLLARRKSRGDGG